MSKTMGTVLVAVVVAVGANGCGVHGDWKRVGTDPPQAMFPLDRLHLDSDNHYSAQWKHKGRKLGSTGTYQYRAGTLSIAESGRAPRDYGAHIRLDGKLELTYTVNGSKVTAILERKTMTQGKPKPAELPKSKTTEPNGATP